MNDLIDLARKKRSRLIAELESLDNFIRTADQLQRESVPGPGSRSIEHAKQGLVDALVTSKKARVVEFCKRLLQERGAMPLNEIYRELQRAGISPGTAQPKGMLSIILSRSDEFESDRAAGGWRLKK